MPSKSHEDKEWPISHTQARAGNEDDILAVALEALDHYDNNPIDDSEFLADKTKRYLQEIWSQWLRFAERIKAHPEDTWLALCIGSDDAKARCRAFLESYVRTSMVKRPCLGGEERQEVRTVNCAVTLEDVWSALVRNADENVLKRKRGEDRERAHLWSLRCSSRDEGSRSSPAYEIGQWIPQLAMKLGLSLKQLFTKRETTPEDIILILSTLWSRAEDIRCSPSTRLAFDCSIILGGIGGWRPKSVVTIKYEQVQFAWVRDPFDPQITRRAATVTIRHVKQRQNRIQRGQRSEVKFSITTVPCRQLCLLTFWASRALADNAFEAGFTASSQVFRAEPLEPGIDYVPLLWKSDTKDKFIHTISCNTYWSIWNRALFVSGLRDEDAMRPYAMRVGGGGRLDGSLTAPLQNFILSNSTEVYEHSYLPIHLNKDLMKVAYRDKAGQNEEIVSMMSRAFLRRDPYAPIYITKDDFASFEKRNDLSSLRKQYREAKDDPVKAQKIKARIKYLLDWLERLRIQEVRKEYFAEVDRLGAQGTTTQHLRTTQATNPRKKREVVGGGVAVRIGKLLDEDVGPVPAATVLLAYLQEKSEKEVFPQEQITAHERQPAALSRCLLSNYEYANVSSLTRHVRKHHEDTSREPFDCPECQRTGETQRISALPAAWSNHVLSFHGRQHTPNLRSKPKPEREKRARRACSSDGVTARRKRRKLEDEPDNGPFKPKWEQTPDPHVDEEFWVTGRCHDYDEVDLGLFELGCIP
ncbi:hypothetical protein Purlil1_13380 [Purpureocillium lilacinum]|uniref:FluG domain-containing protein n=1 Tax=Purpureocillium lilacinum TaxID=33203 RepID=A0ABR0BE83_PURLI|nr:hypothetical protein Purlil1_13380 [Purpureocillium lilacinum]